MTEADIKKMLGGFKVKQNKARHMEKVVADLERQLEKAQADAAEEAAMPRAMVIDGMPRGTSPGDPTGRIGAALADGKVRDEEVERIRHQLKDAKDELALLKTDIGYMETWVYSLMPREFTVVNCRLVLGMSWGEVGREYQKDFGDEMSERTLSRMLDRAIHQIWLIAEG